jgi:hypothetical protein
MDNVRHDMLMRMVAFDHVRRLGEAHHLTATESKPGFVFQDECIVPVTATRHLQAAADVIPAVDPDGLPEGGRVR